MSLFSGHTVGVSKAGVIRAMAPPPVPPSCSPPLTPLTTSNEAGRVHFSLKGSGGQGYIGFEMTKQQRGIFNEK